MNVYIRLKHSKEKRNGLVALKLDISKAYDRVKWLFLKQTILKLGFAQLWVDIIRWCITIAFFSVIINGTAKDLIYPQKSLRQGCPLSPYLFIMCAEVFSVMLQRAERK